MCLLLLPDRQYGNLLFFHFTFVYHLQKHCSQSHNTAKRLTKTNGANEAQAQRDVINDMSWVTATDAHSECVSPPPQSTTKTTRQAQLITGVQ